MSTILTCQMKAYIQPFERALAYRELQALTRATFHENAYEQNNTTFCLQSNMRVEVLARELAFWETISNGQSIITRQSRRESSVTDVATDFDSDEHLFPDFSCEKITLPNRRCLRYGPHGVHEYRGKFFPQLVRAFINIGHVPEGGIIADPFLGSGTTAIETVLAERRAFGVDMNPLSVFMARTKCEILAVSFEELDRSYRMIREKLADCGSKEFDSWISRLSSHDQEYLGVWFHPAVLKDLDRIAASIRSLNNMTIRNFMLLCLSNILRRVSWQKEADLRVRRELKRPGDLDPVKEFLDELERSMRLMLAFLRLESGPPRGNANIRHGDSRCLSREWRPLLDKVDAIITSPPYATALPYLDTDRLSLCFLGLLRRSAYRHIDREMIGNREITGRMRKELWDAFCADECSLPNSVSGLIRRVHTLNENSSAGFRRQNLPSLLYKYFSDMGKVFEGMFRLLKKGSDAFLVIGNNHTVAGDVRVNIDTVELLRDLAELSGFQTVDQLDMEMLTPRNIFKKNAIESECILHFRKPS